MAQNEWMKNNTNDYQMEDEIMMEERNRTTEEQMGKMDKVGKRLEKVSELVSTASQVLVAIGEVAGALTQIAGASHSIKTARNKAKTEYIKSVNSRKWHESVGRKLDKRAKRM